MANWDPKGFSPIGLGWDRFYWVGSGLGLVGPDLGGLMLSVGGGLGAGFWFGYGVGVGSRV